MCYGSINAVVCHCILAGELLSFHTSYLEHWCGALYDKLQSWFVVTLFYIMSRSNTACEIQNNMKYNNDNIVI